MQLRINSVKIIRMLDRLQACDHYQPNKERSHQKGILNEGFIGTVFFFENTDKKNIENDRQADQYEYYQIDQAINDSTLSVKTVDMGMWK